MKKVKERWRSTHFSIRSKIFRVLCVFSSTRGVYSSKDVRRSRSRPSRPSGAKWSCLLLRIVLQDALSEVIRIYPPLKLRVFVDDITAKGVAGNGKEEDEEAERGI